MGWLISSAPDNRGSGHGFESGISYVQWKTVRTGRVTVNVVKFRTERAKKEGKEEKKYEKVTRGA